MKSTSEKAYAEIQEGASTQRAHVLSFVRHHPGVTRNILSRETGITINCVAGRVNELLVSGDLVEQGASRDPVTLRENFKLYATDKNKCSKTQEIEQVKV